MNIWMLLGTIVVLHCPPLSRQAFADDPCKGVAPITYFSGQLLSYLGPEPGQAPSLPIVFCDNTDYKLPVYDPAQIPDV